MTFNRNEMLYHLKYEGTRGHADHSPSEHAGNGEAVHAACLIKQSAMKHDSCENHFLFRRQLVSPAHLLMSLW